MTVDGSYGEQGLQRIVFAGSENFTETALRDNFENWVKVIADEQTDNFAVFDAYLANFNAIMELSTPVQPPSDCDAPNIKGQIRDSSED